MSELLAIISLATMVLLATNIIKTIKICDKQEDIIKQQEKELKRNLMNLKKKVRKNNMEVKMKKIEFMTKMLKQYEKGYNQGYKDFGSILVHKLKGMLDVYIKHNCTEQQEVIKKILEIIIDLARDFDELSSESEED